MAEALLAGKERFFGSPAPGLGLKGFETHHRLLEAYGKVHRQNAKAV
jgi:ribosomal protein S12 methylthiotransferase accessory factor